MTRRCFWRIFIVECEDLNPNFKYCKFLIKPISNCRRKGGTDFMIKFCWQFFCVSQTVQIDSHVRNSILSNSDVNANVVAVAFTKVKKQRVTVYNGVFEGFRGPQILKQALFGETAKHEKFLCILGSDRSHKLRETQNIYDSKKKFLFFHLVPKFRFLPEIGF